MSFLKKQYFLLIALFIGGGFLRADLFVNPVVSTEVGVTTQFEYVSSDIVPPDGRFGKVVLIVDDTAIRLSTNPTGSLDVVFDKPGTVHYYIKTYSMDGEEMDSIERSILVYGIGLSQPNENDFFPLGSRLFLAAEAVFLDKSVNFVEFELSESGANSFSKILGSKDSIYPYSFLYEPAEIGVWDIQAVAFHPDGSVSKSIARTIQVGGNTSSEKTYVTVLDPASGNQVEAGIPRMVNVDVSTHGGPVLGVDLYVDGILLDTTRGQDVTYPFQFEWIPRRPGNYSIVAIVEDNSGAFIASDEVIVTASDDRPHVVFTNPSTGSYFEAGTSIPLMALAVGQGGSRERVSGVEFLVNGSVIPFSGGNSAVTLDDTAPYSALWTPEFPGSYFVSARVIDRISGSSYECPSIRLNVKTASLPIVTLQSPVVGDQCSVGDTYTFRASGDVSHGLIVGVDFYLNDVWLGAGVATDQGFTFDHVFNASGIYRVKALAMTSGHRQISSSTVTMTVDARSHFRPEVEIGWPDDGAVFSTGDSVQIGAVSSDSDGNVDYVQFFVNGQKIGESDHTFPFLSEEFTFQSAGQYRIEAVAVDNNGNQSKRSMVTVAVKDPSMVRPVVEISSPKVKETYQVGSSVFIEAMASDEDGFIESVSFFVNGKIVGTEDHSFPYQSNLFDVVHPGIHRVTVVAIDDQGNMSLPASVVFYGIPPKGSSEVIFNPLKNNRDFIIQLYLDLFARGPTDSELNRHLEKLDFESRSRAEIVEDLYTTFEFQNMRHTHNAFHSIFGDWPSPIEFSSSLQGIEPEEEILLEQGQDDVGDTFSSASMIPLDDSRFSGSLGTVGDVDMFVFQVHTKNMVTLSTTGAFDSSGNLYTSEGELIASDDDSGMFFNFSIQQVLEPGTYYIGVSGWSGSTGSYDLEIDFGNNIEIPIDSMISTVELEQTVSFLYRSDRYLKLYGASASILNRDSSRRSHFAQLYRNRFGVDPSFQQIQQGSARMIESGSIEAFIGSFVRNDRVGLSDFIYNLPDVISRDDGAFLIRSFFKQKPDSDGIELLVESDFLTQVERILSDPRYTERFTGNEVSIQVLGTQVEITSIPEIQSKFALDWKKKGEIDLIEASSKETSPFQYFEEINGWKYLEWFGWFSDASYPWIFHEKLGWIKTSFANEDEWLIWQQELDWTYTSSDSYPYLYRYSDESWILLKPGDEPGQFDIEE